jgi:hypothetical protein
VTPPEILDTFRALKTLLPDANGLRVVDIGAHSRWPAFLAVDTMAQEHLLIQVASDAPLVDDSYSEGVRLGVRILLDGGRLLNYVDLALGKPHLVSLFAVIVSEVLELLKDQPGTAPALAASHVLERWRELLAAAGRPIGLERLTGLFGELWQLREIVRQAGPQAVTAWTGPSGAKHDFEGASSHDLEVKTSRGRTVRVVTISSLDQLQLGEATTLHLAAMRIEPVGSGGQTAMQLVESLIAHGCPSPGVAERLAYLGITYETLEASGTAFAVRENLLYPVNDAFPRLNVGDSTPFRLPPQITRVRYDIDLTSQPPAPVPADEMANLYRRLGGASA